MTTRPAARRDHRCQATDETPAHGGSGGPMVRRILLGAQLRRLREGRGITREQAGYSIRASESKISRMELGRVRVKERDVEDLLTYYGVVAAADREPVLRLARDSNRAGWWHSYNDVLPGWFQTYIGLEAAASRIATYEVQFVHGLLQTEAYARAVTRAGGRGRLTPAEVERRVVLRMTRQRLLCGEEALRLVCFLDEACLHRVVGGRDVMDGQLRHLAEMAEHPQVTMRVVPFSRGGHAAESGAFTLLRFPEAELPDVVYVEQLTGALYLDKREEIARYDEALGSLAELALTPAESREKVRRLRQLL
jgi:transcriptional regulator with XRE-family HTH domain